MHRYACVLALLCACATTKAPTDTPDAATEIDAKVIPDAGPDFCNATDPRAVPVAIVPTPEAGEQPYLDALATAQSSIRVQIYEMGYGGILDQLVAKAGAGIDVRVMFDQSKKSVNQKYYDQLAAAGAHVKWSDPKFTYQHSKFFLVDASVAVLSTGNFSENYSIDLERNFVATDRDQADLADVLALFDADWDGATPEMSCTRMIISPINSRSRLIELIDSAQTTLTIESMQFADTAVRDAVKARVMAGVSVRVMLAEASWITANAGAATFLQGLGVTVKSIPHLHTKAIVVDGTSAYVGSENLSYTSLDKNRELGVIVTDASSIAPIASTFEADWAIGTSF